MQPIEIASERFWAKHSTGIVADKRHILNNKSLAPLCDSIMKARSIRDVENWPVCEKCRHIAELKIRAGSRREAKGWQQMFAFTEDDNGQGAFR